jgi:hypothetical protein
MGMLGKVVGSLEIMHRKIVKIVIGFIVKILHRIAISSVNKNMNNIVYKLNDNSLYIL